MISDRRRVGVIARWRRPAGGLCERSVSLAREVARIGERVTYWSHDRFSRGRTEMASTRQVRAAKQNVQKAQQAARQKRTIANLPESTRRELGKQAAKGRQRGGRAGHALEDRNREQLYEIAKEQDIRGRSKMGKWDLIEAIRRSR